MVGSETEPGTKTNKTVMGNQAEEYSMFRKQNRQSLTLERATSILVLGGQRSGRFLIPRVKLARAINFQLQNKMGEIDNVLEQEFKLEIRTKTILCELITLIITKSTFHVKYFHSHCFIQSS